MQRRHRYLWIKGSEIWYYTHDGAFSTPKISKKDKIMCRKKKRLYFKNLTKKELDVFKNEQY